MVVQKENSFYKNFANENRVKLILCLSKSQSVTDLLHHCHLSQSALSQHLKILKDGGIVTCKRDGKKQMYTIINKKVLEIARQLVLLEKNNIII